ncbi:GldG family protein [candidate division FCPU426 bacterium]|nr:GldG family protein [candidate division FCPU426 bacterium]
MNTNENTRQQLNYFLILIGILVLVNIISVRTFLRLDLTKTGAYSLSAVSKKYMRELKDPLTVKAFFTRQLPPPYNANARYLRDLLDDYRTYSRGKFNYQFVDPADDPILGREARSLGVYEIQLTAVERDKFEQKNGYMGLAMIYGNKKEVIPLIQDTSGLEYQLTSMIKKLLQSEMKVVGITQGHGEAAMAEGLSNFVDMISKNYEVVPVDLAQGGIPERVSALMVAGPTRPLPEDKLYLLDHFLRSGRNLAMFVPMIKADARTTMQGQLVDSKLSRLITAWGARIQPDLVYDAQCQKISVAQRGPGFIMQNIVPYPPFPLVTHVDEKHLIVKNLESFTLPFVSSLGVNEEIVKANKLNASVLAKSSPYAWSQQRFFMLSPQFIQPPTKEEMKQFDLIVTLAGAFPSAFAADKLPAPSQAGESLPAFIAEAKPARVLVIGGADMLSNDFLDPRRQDGLAQFVLNMVDWVAQDAALIDIRSKGPAPAALGKVSEAHRQAVKYFNLIGLPLLVVLFGLFMWRRLEARRLVIAAQFHK